MEIHIYCGFRMFSDHLKFILLHNVSVYHKNVITILLNWEKITNNSIINFGNDKRSFIMKHHCSKSQCAKEQLCGKLVSIRGGRQISYSISYFTTLQLKISMFTKFNRVYKNNRKQLVESRVCVSYLHLGYVSHFFLH